MQEEKTAYENHDDRLPGFGGGMSYQLMVRALHIQAKMPALSRCVLVALAERADHDGSNCFPSIGWIAEAICSDRTSVRRCVANLRDLGFVVDVPASYRGRSNSYRVVLPPIDGSPNGCDSHPTDGWPSHRGEVAQPPIDGWPSPHDGWQGHPDSVSTHICNTGTPESVAQPRLALVQTAPPPAPPAPSQPDPKPKRVRAEIGTRLDRNWQLPDDGRAFATSLGLDPDQVLAEFKDYWCGLGGVRSRKVDWTATYRNRCRETAKRERRLNQPRETRSDLARRELGITETPFLDRLRAREAIEDETDLDLFEEKQPHLAYGGND